MWQCPKCRETIDDNFDACWNCGTNREGTPAADSSRQEDDRAVPDSSPESEKADRRPSGSQGPGEPPLDRLVAVASFNFPAEAELHKLALEREGIQALVAEDNAFGTLSVSAAGVKVLVAESDAPRARRVFQQVASSRLPGEAEDEELAGEVVFPCQECAAWIAFPASRRGRVETCPLCKAHVDVPE